MDNLIAQMQDIIKAIRAEPTAISEDVCRVIQGYIDELKESNIRNTDDTSC